MKIIISNVKNQPIYEQIYEQIKNLIITEELEAGQMLPSIRGLAKDLRTLVPIGMIVNCHATVALVPSN